MSEPLTAPTEDESEDWADEAQRAANRARMYAEIAKRKASEAAGLNVRTGRLLRTMLIVGAAFIVADVAAAVIVLWWRQ